MVNRRGVTCDVIVVGAGMSGLAAARALTMRGIDDVITLDARSEPGGRCAVRPVSTGDEIDIGGAFTHPTQTHIRGLAGTETADIWMNHLSGAVQAGERAAEEVAQLTLAGANAEPAR
jgi:monoamine oxidase